MQKDQLIELSLFLSSQKIDLDNVKEIVDLKAKMPKIYQDFEKIDKLFEKSKTENRVFGRHKLSVREKGQLLPDD